MEESEKVSVVGQTRSVSWIAGGFDTVYNGSYDIFIVVLDTSGVFQWSSYLGGPNEDVAADVQADEFGNLFVTGRTASDGWVRKGFDTSYGGASDAFLARIAIGEKPFQVMNWRIYH